MPRLSNGKTVSHVARLFLSFMLICSVTVSGGLVSSLSGGFSSSNTAQYAYGLTANTNDSCEQATPILPSTYNVSSIWDYKDQIIEWHQGVIRVPTEVYDVMGPPGEDERWEVFGDLHAYLEQAYPLIHKHLKKTTVDTYGLVYEWAGTDPSLKPLFLAGHQDVVPVLPDTVSQWKQDPYNGTYDGTYIWGRGSNDDKSGLTSIMASIELLLMTSNFRPSRTVILAFGHDEETGGKRGAVSIRDWMLSHYGTNSVCLIVDEGSGIVESWGTMFGTAGVAEKGRTVINMTLSTLGGHSSVPPKHTNIGLTSLLIAELERNPHPATMERSSPIWGYLQCASEYAPGMPKQLKSKVQRSQKSKTALRNLPEDVVELGLGDEQDSPGMGNRALSLISTTQAVDLVHGGFKVNALPEVVTTIIDHRIDISSNLENVFKHVYETILPVAKDLNLSISGLGHSYEPEKPAGYISLSEAYEAGFDPAPISPTDISIPAWRVFAGTSRAVWATRPFAFKTASTNGKGKSDELIMAPYMATGNTDTRRYLDLTPHIYRWKHLIDIPGSHTINERVVADDLIEYTRFYQALILNVDAAEDL